MVRLKGINAPCNGEVKVISIPYGAIKRFGSMTATVQGLTFQFLMVRLKVLKL